MGKNTSFLNLYQPGGGATGTNTPDEVADVDRLNQNFVLIDDFAKATDTRLDTAEAQVYGDNRNYTGPAAGVTSLVGMKRGDTYQDTDGSFLRRYYDGTNWVVPGLIFMGVVSGASHTNNVFTNWGQTSGPAQTYNESFDPLTMHDASTNPERIVLPWSGVYRVSLRVEWATNGAGLRAVRLSRNGSSINGWSPQTSAADSSEGHNPSSGALRLSANDYLTVATRQTSGGALALTAGEITVEYLRA